MDITTALETAGQIADDIIDKYLDVTDLSEEVDFDEFTNGDTVDAFANELGRLIADWARGQITAK